MKTDNKSSLKEGLKAYHEKLKSGEIERSKSLNPREKAIAHPKSLRARINRNCWECGGEDKQEVKFCTARNCPFYEIRPWQEKKENTEKGSN